MKKSSKGVRGSAKELENGEMVIDWEIRPGGMLVQKRSGGGGSSSNFGPMITIKVSHDSYQHHLTLPSQSTFGDLKKVLACETSLEPKDQRLLFRGKEKADVECLHMAGVKDMSKVILLEDPASRERKLNEMRENRGMVKAYEAVTKVRTEIDNLSDKVVALETSVKNGTKIGEKEFDVLTELLMVELLKLDGIEADGEAKSQRRIEVRRVQSFVDTLDSLKARNANCFNNGKSGFSVNTKWETFEPGLRSLSVPNTSCTCTKVTHNWEQFD